MAIAVIGLYTIEMLDAQTSFLQSPEKEVKYIKQPPVLKINYAGQGSALDEAQVKLVWAEPEPYELWQHNCSWHNICGVSAPRKYPMCLMYIVISIPAVKYSHR